MTEGINPRWRNVLIGPLAPEFLRFDYANINPQQASYEQQPQPSQYTVQNHVGRLSITCAQAKLSRNYGITRMDPYARIRVGHYVYETQTDCNGGKNPRWNRVIQSQLPIGITSISIEIYDECSFKMDELIAWCEIKIPENVFRGETHEQWYSLSGKLGEALEGSIDIVLSFSNRSTQPYMYRNILTDSNVLMVPPGRPIPIFVTPQAPQVFSPNAEQLKLTEENLKQMQEMFPNIDKEVIKSVFEVNYCKKDATINSLLKMSE